jgi:adenylate kinase family enzyme
LPSSLLSKKIGQYNENLRELLPFLKENTELTEINTEGTFKKIFKEIC